MPTQRFIALASGAQTVSGTADIAALAEGFAEMNIYIAATAVTGTTPSMTVTYQCSHDGVTYFDHTAGTAITAAGNQLIKIPDNMGKFGRISYAISGTTPSFTFSVVAEVKRN